MKIKLSASEIVASVIMGAITYFSYQAIKGSLKNKAKKNEVVKVPTKPIDVFFAKSSETEYSLKKFGDKFLTVKANIDGNISISILDDDNVSDAKGHSVSVRSTVECEMSRDTMRDKAISMFKDHFSNNNSITKLTVQYVNKA